jgi:EF-P beta-lysylation protein EpmB
MSLNAAVQATPTAAGGWQHELRDAIRSAGALFELLDLSPQQIAALDAIDSQFPLLVPRAFANRMTKRNPDDPLLRQVLPLAQERVEVAGFGRDPLEELGVTRAGVVRKYRGRALLITTAACPVHCRYCFRRHFPYERETASREAWEPAVAELVAKDGVGEVILSGGDPLSLANGRLESLLDKLAPISGIRTVRLHSRFPIVLPSRIDAGLLRLVASDRFATVVVIHCNHAQEIDETVIAALRALRSAGAMLLNQSVLLRGVNDDAAALAALSHRLLDAGVLPYYLHELDPVAGAAHFQVPRGRGVALIRQLRRELPGYLVPRYVRELPGEPSKTVLI